MRAIKQEYIGALTAANSAYFTGNMTNTVTDPLQDHITIGLAITFVEHMEVIDIQYQRIGCHIREMLVKLLHIVHEVINVEELGQRITLGSLNDRTVFGKLNALFNSCTNDLPGRIWLWNEVHRAKLQTLYFRILVCG